MVVDKILYMIVNGQYPRGSQLPTENELCEMFVVSRITIREALKRLQMMNVIDIQQGKGTFVSEIGLGTFMQPMFNLIDFGDFDVSTIYDSRQYIETGTCRLAAINRTEQDVKRLQALIEASDHALKNNEMDRIAEIDREFHIEIAAASKNQILKAAVINLENVSAACAKRINKTNAVMANALSQHRQICQAIEMQDPDMAEKIIVEHTLRSKEFLM
jgi:GntR family transcriptional repressor for pyruvate dehydrogenase complex